MPGKKSITTLFAVIVGIFLAWALAPALSAAAQLTPAEKAGLLQMREEEKMARDVYLAFHVMYGTEVFLRISHCEQQHMDAMKTLLDSYGLPDPASPQRGAFTNPTLQALYDSLIVSGARSLPDALKGGGAVEEIDILDLRFFDSQTSKADIRQVYGFLLQGSYHHLNMFASTLLGLTGEVYSPQYLDRASYDAIISSGGCGGGGGMRNRGGR